MSASVIGIGRGSFCFTGVLVSQSDCFMEVKLSVFGVHWVSVIALSHPPRDQSAQDFPTRYKNLKMFLFSYRKICWLTWN